jgi:PIN domain nuclease of toxin-antitoxin system
MKYMLDTNAWLRAVGRLSELNAAAQAVLADPANAPFALSAISVWEVCTKFRKKPAELSIVLPLDEWLSIALQPKFVHVISVDADIARASNELPLPIHEDPADRIIVASSRRHGLQLLTSDAKLIEYPHVQTLDTR